MAEGTADHDIWIVVRVLGAIELHPLRQLIRLIGDPGQHAAFDAGEITDQQTMPGRRADRGAGDVADDLDRRAERAHGFQIAVHDHSKFAVSVFALAAEVLRLRATAGPATGRGAVEFKGAANSAVDDRASLGGSNLLAEACAASRRSSMTRRTSGAKLGSPQRLRQGRLLQVFHDTAARGQPGDDLVNLIGGLDLAAGELFDLGLHGAVGGRLMAIAFSISMPSE